MSTINPTTSGKLVAALRGILELKWPYVGLVHDRAMIKARAVVGEYDAQRQEADSRSKRIEQGVPRYVVDGKEFANEESDYLGDGQYPPFVVFDVDKQENVPGEYSTRDVAQEVADAANARESVAWIFAPTQHDHGDTFTISDGSGDTVARTFANEASDQEAAHRIVACVNACAGILTDALTARAGPRAVAELVEAGKALNVAFEVGIICDPPGYAAAKRRFDAALAHVTPPRMDAPEAADEPEGPRP